MGDQISATSTVKNITDIEAKFPVVAGDIGANAATLAKLDASNSTANKALMSGASASPTWSTPTFPNASATSGKVIKSDGTNWVASTETYAAPGTANNVMTSDGTNWTSAAAAGGAGAMTLLHEGTGTDTNAAAANIDTYAVSGLTAKDSLVVYVTLSSVTQDTAGVIYVYQTTDGKNMAKLTAGVLTAGQFVQAQAVIGNSNTALTDVNGISTYGMRGNGDTAGAVAMTAQNWTTNWTGSWSIAIRHAGVTAGGTFYYRWAIYKIAGQ